MSKFSIETVYRFMSSACYEIILLHGVLSELGYSQTQLTMLHVDRQVQYKLH